MLKSSAQAPAHRLVCIAVMVLLGGCANPIVKLEIAGYSLQASPAPVGEPESMAQAIAKLNHVRAAYNEAIRDQTGVTQNSVTGLVWLGAVVLGAASHVHRDVLVTAGVVGGTTYGLTAAQLDKRRIDVWQAGIDALDCARKAIVPLEMSDNERHLLVGHLAKLWSRKADVETAQAKLAARQGDRSNTAEVEQAIKALLPKADEALKQASKSLEAGEMQLRASRGSELSATVNRISSKVTQVQGTVSLPVSAVNDILAELPKQITAIVPGALPPAAPASDGTANAQTEDPTQVLKQALSDLAVAQKTVNQSLEKVNTPAALAALKACNVADVIKPFELVPAFLNFTQGIAEVKGFEIKGGLPNYRVKILGTLPDGLSTNFEGDSANTVGVGASDTVKPSEVRILVSDRSNPAQTQQLVIKVNAVMTPAPIPAPTPAPKPATIPKLGPTALTPTPAPAPAPKPAPALGPTADPASSPKPLPAPAPGNAAATEAAWKELQAALMAPGFSRSLRGVTLGVEATEFKAGRIIVKLKCSKPNAGLPAIEVREELLVAAPNAMATLRSNNALDGKLQQIDLSRSKPCVKD